MKKILFLTYFKVAVLMFLIVLVSCKKSTTDTTNIDNLFTETKDNLQRNEPLLLSFGDNTTLQTIVWKCVPNNNVSINQVEAYITCQFANAGQYTITATNGNKQGTYIVNVNNVLYDEIGSTFNVTASKLINVKTNEDVAFTVHNSASTVSTTNWSVQSIPSSSLNFSNNNNTATVNFQTSGAKYITFSNGTQTQTKAIWVDDNVSPDSKFVPFIFSDKMNITPKIEVVGSNKNLVLTTTSTYNYECYSDKIIADTYEKNGNYLLSFGGVKMNTTPCSYITQASVVNSFSNLTIGNHLFSINYQNKTFTGSIDVATDGTHTINFTNNNLVNFTKTIVK